MHNSARDPLLISAKVLIYFLMAAAAVAALALALAAPAVSFLRGHVLAELGDGFPAPYFWLLPAGMLMGLAAAGMALAFLDQLRRIVATVGLGDPFAPINADRLKRMGWLSLGVVALQIPLAMFGSFFEQIIEQGNEMASLTVDGNLSVEGLVLALTLFILARVFRHGAAMRDELDGTV